MSGKAPGFALDLMDNFRIMHRKDRNSNKALLIFAAAAFFCSMASCAGNGTGGKPAPRAAHGVMDLEDYDFSTMGPVKLDGEWEFFWKAFLVSGGDPHAKETSCYKNVPGNWNRFTGGGGEITGKGYGTYRLKILLPQMRSPLAFRVMDIGTAYTLYVNGRKTAAAGVPGRDARTSKPWYQPKISTLDTENAGEIVICVEASNFHEVSGGIWDSITLGLEKDLRSHRDKNGYLEFMICGAILFMGLYHLSLFILRPKNLSNLYFFIVCALIACRLVMTHERYLLDFMPVFSWTMLHKIEFLTFSLSVWAFASFIRVIFPNESSPAFHRLTCTVSLAYSAMILSTPSLWYASLLQVFQAATIVIACYILYVIIKAAADKRTGSIAILVGFIVLFAAVVNDILHQNQLIHTRFLAPAGLFILLFSQAVVIAIRFSRAFDSVERLKEEAEAASLAKTQFIANMSHELRTPLNAVIGMAGLMSETALDGTQKEFVSIIQSSSSHLSAIVNDILDLSKIESGQFFIENSVFDLKEAAENVHTILLEKAVEKRIDFTLSVHPDVETSVRGDADRLKQVLFNLAGNALKFTDQGFVSIHIDMVEKKNDEEVLAFRVKDTGMGIEPEKFSFLFKPFSQADMSMTRKHGGTGLGLVISKYIVELMGGTLNVDSRPGKGSEFRFTLPFSYKGKASVPSPQKQEENQMTVYPETAPAMPGARILIVEDNPANRKLAEILVKKIGCDYESVSDGREAVNILRKKTFDLVLMDIQMPNLDGLEAARIIRDPGSDILDHSVPIIAMTAHAMKADREKCLASGMNDYLTKPIKPQSLSESIGRQLAAARSVYFPETSRSMETERSV
jgi:signal transduction histidine kinase/CheY-like chemotaxis protein